MTSSPITELPITVRTRVQRKPERQVLDRDALNAVLDEALLAHVAFVRGGEPVVLPVAVARDGGDVLFHGSTAGGLFAAASTPGGLPVSVCVTLLDGLVYARSVFDSSMNYRSVVIHGVAFAVPAEQKAAALRVVSEHLLPGRWDELRPVTTRELAATSVLRVSLAEASLKVRAEGASEEPDDGEDHSEWAGVLPLSLQPGTPEPSTLTPAGTALPGSIRRRAAQSDSSGTELRQLRQRLDAQRDVIVQKAAGLTREQLAQPLPPSTLTLGGLLNHLAMVEDWWFSVRFHGQEVQEPWASVDWDADPDWDWHSAAEDTPEQLLTLWRDAVARSRSVVTEALAGGGLDQLARYTNWTQPPSLRRILPEDFHRFDRMESLYRQAVVRGWINGSEAMALNFLAAAVRAREHGRDPARLFVALVRQGLWSHITQGQEEKARCALARFREANPDRFRARPAMRALKSPSKSGSKLAGLRSEVHR